MSNSLQSHIAHQAPLSKEFSRQVYWNGLPFPSPVDLSNPRIEPMSLMSPALACGLFNISTTWEAPDEDSTYLINAQNGI